MVGALKAHQGDAVPVVPLLLAGVRVLRRDIIAGVPVRVRLQGAVIPADETIHAAAVHDLNLDHGLGLFALIVLLHHIDVDGGVQDGVVSVRPKGQDLIRRETLKGQRPALIVGVKPGLAAYPGTLSHRPHRPPETGPQHRGQGRRIVLALRVERKRAAKRVIGLLVHHF